MNDADGWIPYWLSLHNSAYFAGKFTELVTECLAEPFEDGAGSSVLRFREDDGTDIEVEVKYLLEQFPKGRVFHVDSIRSPGDRLPPFALS